MPCENCKHHLYIEKNELDFTDKLEHSISKIKWGGISYSKSHKRCWCGCTEPELQKEEDSK